MGNRRILTVSELAAHLNIHRITIYRLLKAGNLPGFKIGRVWRFDLDEIGAWMDNGKAFNTDYKEPITLDPIMKGTVQTNSDHKGSTPDPRSSSRRSFEGPVRNKGAQLNDAT